VSGSWLRRAIKPDRLPGRWNTVFVLCNLVFAAAFVALGARYFARGDSTYGGAWLGIAALWVFNAWRQAKA
jgi:hypothetical protein